MTDDGPEWITATKRAVDRASDAVQAHAELTALTAASKALDTALDEVATLRRASALGRERGGTAWTSPPNCGPA